MSLQVGASCYATAADAGRAACSQFSPVATLSGTTLKTVSCSASHATTGALLLDVVETDTVTQATTTTQVSQLVTFPPCVQQDYLDAAEVIISGLLAVWVIWYSGHKLISFLGWTRGSAD